MEALEQHLPDWEWTRPEGGLSIWVRLPHGSATELAQLALRHRVALVPGPYFDPHGRHDRFLRLPYVLSEAALELGAKRLAEAWHAYADDGRKGVVGQQRQTG